MLMASIIAPATSTTRKPTEPRRPLGRRGQRPSSDSCWQVVELGAAHADVAEARRNAGSMPRARPAPPHPSAVRDLVEAVQALSDDPGPGNVERYLAASRALEESRPAPVRGRARARGASERAAA